MHRQLLGLALLLYSVGLAHTVLTVLRKKQTLFKPAVISALLGLLCHAGATVLRAYELRAVPLGQRYETFSLVALVAVIAFLLIHWRYKIASLGVFAFPAIFVMTFMANLAFDPKDSIPTILQSHWIYIHAPLVILGYVALFISFSAAVLYLLQERELKSKQPKLFYKSLPPLETCDDLAYKALAIGFPLMTLGILSGALWAQQVWGSSWTWDWKILLSFSTWLIYLLLISYRLIAGIRGKKAAHLAIAGFVVLLVTFLGANSFSGSHSFTP